jgi:hypothetical protein
MIDNKVAFGVLAGIAGVLIAVLLFSNQAVSDDILIINGGGSSNFTETNIFVTTPITKNATNGNVLIACPTCLTNTQSWKILANVSAPNANTTLQTGSIAGYKYYHIQVELITQTSASTWGMQFNRDTGNNYAYRYSQNFAGSITAITQNNMNFIENIGSGVVFINIFCQQTTNIGHQKLCNVELTENDSPPTTIELFGMWTNTSTLIDNVRLVRTAGTGTMTTASNMVVLGHN